MSLATLHDEWSTLSLHPDHQADLVKSGLSPETVRRLGIHTIHPREIVRHLGFREERITSLLCFPYPGENGFCRDKIFPSNLKDRNGHGMRYLQRPRTGSRLYIPPLAQSVLHDVSVPLRFTEGEKKSAKACQEGYPTIGLGGLWNFSADGDLLPKFREIALDGRRVILVPDSEVWTHRTDLLRPVYRFGTLLEQRGATVEVEVLLMSKIRMIHNNTALDDFLVSAREPQTALDALPRLSLNDQRFRCVAAQEAKGRRVEWGDLTNEGPSRKEEQPGPIVTLAEAIREVDHFAQGPGGKLYVYQWGVYHPGGDQHIKQKVKRLLAEQGESALWSSHLAKEVIEYIRIDAPVLWERLPLDTINVLNGLLNVETKVLRLHSPEWLSIVQLPVNYDPDATCPAWETFVEETFPEDAHQLAYEIPADLMTPDRSLHKALLLTGEGGNGKSTYLAALISFVGKTNIASLSLQKLEADRFAAARLMGKLANICPDLPSTHLTGTSVFKALTGGDTITGEQKYHDSFDFTPSVRLIFSANRPPRSGDDSEAFFQRWLVVKFERTFRGTKKDIPRHELDARLADPAELSGVLNKALAVLPSLRSRSFTESRSMKQAAREFRQTTDPLAVWLDGNTVRGPDSLVTKDALLTAYNTYCEKNGTPGQTQKGFGHAIRKLLPDLKDAQRTVGRKVAWVWVGLGLKTVDVPPPSPPQRAPFPEPQRSRDSRDNPYCCESQSVEERESKNNNKENPVNRVNPVSDNDFVAPPLTSWETEYE